MTNREYLGDGVYVASDSLNGLILTTEIGEGLVTNTIYLDPDVLAALDNYRARQAANQRLNRVYGRRDLNEPTPG